MNYAAIQGYAGYNLYETHITVSTRISFIYADVSVIQLMKPFIVWIY